MIDIRSASLCYSRDAWVLREVALSVQRGAFITLLGPSGCGKSSLLRLEAGLEKPSDGCVLIDEVAPQEFRQRKRGISLVFQEPRLLPWRNVIRNIALPLEISKGNADEQQALIDASLELIGLRADDATKFPRMLSGGMRMRVALARALVTQPNVLLLDEPFAALDDLLRQQLNEELLRIWEERKPTTIFVTHNISEAIFLSQRVVVLASHPGRIRATIEVPFEYPRSHTVRASSEFGALVGQVGDLLRAETP